MTPDFDKMTREEIEQFDRYVNNGLHRTLKRIACAEREIELDTESEVNYVPECE